MTDHPAITLRYFDVRGRGQFIRALLAHRGISFRDERIKLAPDNANWPDIRKDRTISGDFQKLPTLQWGETVVNETLVILDFLQRKLGDADLLGEADALRHAMLASSAFLDLLTPCINLIWCDIFHPGVDVDKTTRGVGRRIGMHLATVDETLTSWGWNEKMPERPVMAADAVLWEALDVIGLTFDGRIPLADYPALEAFHEQCPGAGSFRALLAEKPRSITARPGEAGSLARIHATCRKT